MDDHRRLRATTIFGLYNYITSQKRDLNRCNIYIYINNFVGARPTNAQGFSKPDPIPRSQSPAETPWTNPGPKRGKQYKFPRWGPHQLQIPSVPAPLFFLLSCVVPGGIRLDHLGAVGGKGENICCDQVRYIWLVVYILLITVNIWLLYGYYMVNIWLLYGYYMGSPTKKNTL